MTILYVSFIYCKCFVSGTISFNLKVKSLFAHFLENFLSYSNRPNSEFCEKQSTMNSNVIYRQLKAILFNLGKGTFFTHFLKRLMRYRNEKKKIEIQGKNTLCESIEKFINLILAVSFNLKNKNLVF